VHCAEPEGENRELYHSLLIAQRSLLFSLVLVRLFSVLISLRGFITQSVMSVLSRRNLASTFTLTLSTAFRIDSCDLDETNLSI